MSGQASQRVEAKDKPLNRDVHVGDVVEDEVDKRLVLLLAEKLDERLGRERLTELVRCQAVLGKAKVKVVED